MFTFEKFSRRPEIFRDLIGVDIALFNGMTEKFVIYEENGEIISKRADENITCTGTRIISRRCVP